jgi:hypothetical protein
MLLQSQLRHLLVYFSKGLQITNLQQLVGQLFQLLLTLENVSKGRQSQLMLAQAEK